MKSIRLTAVQFGPIVMLLLASHMELPFHYRNKPALARSKARRTALVARYGFDANYDYPVGRAWRIRIDNYDKTSCASQYMRHREGELQ